MDVVGRIIREPAALLGLVTLLLAGGAVFGWWDLTAGQHEWVLALIGALILVLRQYVTPVASPSLPIGTRVNRYSEQPEAVVAPTDSVVIETVETHTVE